MLCAHRTADDLVALFAWLIVHTGVVHLYSELDFISAFMEEGLFTGDGAYSLTTLQVRSLAQRGGACARVC